MTFRDRAGLSPLAANPRFLAALVLSVLLHFALPLVLSGGVPRSHHVAPLARALSVRVVRQPEHPQADASPSTSAPTAEEPREIAPKRPVPAVREADVARAASPAAPPQPARPAGAVPEAPDFTYYATKQLDVYPAPSAPLDLKYRGKAADDGVTGRALLLVLIDELGTVRDVSVVEAEPASYFEDDAKRAIMSARFSPAYRNGRAVRSRVLIEVNYGVERGSP